MKKILAFASAVVLAAVAQAASVTWGSGVIYLADGTTKASTTAAKKVTAFYITVDQAVYAAFSSGDYADYIDIDKDTGKVSLKSAYSTKTQTKTSGATGAANGSATINEGETLYVLAIYSYTGTDGTAYIKANKATATMKAGDAGATVTPNGKLAENISTWTAVPVPEPCTVALLALGLAAVGLKRKVA